MSTDIFTSPPLQPKQQQPFLENNFASKIQAVGVERFFTLADSTLTFDGSFFQKAADFLNAQGASVDEALKYTLKIAEAAKNKDNPPGYIFRIFTRDDVWARFRNKAVADSTPPPPAEKWVCPCCGKSYPAESAACDECGLTDRSTDRDTERAQKKRELSENEFAVWLEERQRERFNAAKEERAKFMSEFGRGVE